MNAKPAIAILRRQEATAKFNKKLEVLERLLEEGSQHRFPQRVSVASFASWEDPELGVLPVSRSIIYDESAEYLQLRTRMEHLLQRIEVIRVRTGKRGSIEADLRRKLETAEAKAQEYLNQYSAARAELLESQREIERLNARIRRQISEDARVTPLKRVSADAKDSE